MPYNRVHFENMEEVYSEYTKSERWLLILLGVMTGVAILIAVFGIYSMITLACNQRRKEMAIRKVNGAKAKEILALFFSQYFAVTVVACAVAFPVGVQVMQCWLVQYIRRVSMEWWLFAGVFALVVTIVFISMAFRVWKAANENPAEVVKAE
jgi:ABC-type antimicrobial peptide transport system permease subunit